MCHNHASAAVASAAYFVEGFAVGDFLSQEIDVGLPEIGYDL